MAPLPLTLLTGGHGLARLVGQLIDPPNACLVVASKETLKQANIPNGIGVSLDSALPAGDGGQTATHSKLVRAILLAAKQTPSIRRIIVALDENDDAVAAALAVLSEKALGRLVRLDAVIATVDAVHFSTRISTGQPIDNATELNRLAIADRILVARSKDVTPPLLGAIGHVLRSINQTGPIIAPAIATCSLVDLLDLDAWSGSPKVGPRPARRSPFLGPDAPAMVVCRVERPLDPQALDHWLNHVLDSHACGVLRLQGAVNVKGDQRRKCLHGVRSCLISSHEPVDQAEVKDRESLVALIGRGLPATAIQKSFASCDKTI